MDSFTDLITSYNSIDLLLFIILLICIVLFSLEGYKFYKYKMKSDLMDFSLLGVVFFGSYLFLGKDLFLSGLSVIFVLMVIGTYEIRESPVWLRLMAAFTLTYGYLLVGGILDKILNGHNQIFGLFWSTMLWVLLISSLLFFGKKFILVSRFLSPQYVYLFAYSLVYVFILWLDIPWAYRYLALFCINAFIYSISGYLLTFLFQIKPLNDERSLKVVKEIESKIGTKIRAIGIVQAPILNAFAYGPFFDQRFTFIVKDINDFTDEELLGISAHEIAHLKGKHTFWLLWLGFFDLFIRFIFGIPASTFDFAAGIAKGWNLFNYYVVNLLFFAVALIFVRLMEANADKRAKEIGYGSELAEALYTLEGFYRGIAGELGLNAQLLTDSTRTEAEEKRFTGEAAIEMHNRLMNPSRYGLAMNLIVSHPPTPFRIAAMLSDEISSIRLALLPILLILPGTRSRNIRLLRKKQAEFAELLTVDYKKKFIEVENFTSSTFTIHSLNYYMARGVLLKSKLDRKEHYIGTLKSVQVSDNIADPYLLILETETGKQQINSKFYTIQVYEPGELYLGRNKQIMTLKSVELSKKGKYLFTYEKDSKVVQLKYLGVNIKDFSSENSFIMQTRGKYEPMALQTINGENAPFPSINSIKTLGNVPFSFKTYNPGNEINLKGKQMKINLSPIVIFLYKRYEKENLALVKYLIEAQTRLILYTSKDPDIGIPCIISNVVVDEINKTKTIYFKSSGETKEDAISLKQLDALVLRNPYKLVQSTKEIGFFSKLFNSLLARGSRFNYI